MNTALNAGPLFFWIPADLCHNRENF